MVKKKPDTNYHFQDRVTDLALAGEDIILQAPTGAGKTRAAMLPALKGFERSVEQYPQRMGYFIPTRSLATSFVDQFSDIAQKNSRWLDNEWRPTIQTGERPEDALFEGKLIFATVDQMLASFLNIPYGIPKRLDNINTGAFIGSYLIFDEFHLYPSKEMMLTVLAMLKMLKGISRFTLMTATFSRSLLDALKDLLGAEIIADAPNTPVAEGLFADVKDLHKQDRIWSAHAETLTGQHIHDALRDHQTVLCVCNQVGRAQAVYENFIRSGDNLDHTDCVLLHSRFFQADRQRNQEKALCWLRKNPPNDGRRKVVIATQVIEVGLDISAEMLLTECAPAASLIQRAGRCVRWGGTGYVQVFQPPAKDDGDAPDYAPYHNADEGLQTVCENTWNALTSTAFGSGQGKSLRYHDEQHLIDQAHGEHDQETITNGLERKIETRIDRILDCMRTRESAQAHYLIRKNTSVPLYIMADRTDARLTDKPHSLEALSISQGRIAFEWDSLTAHNADAPFLIAAGMEAPDTPEGDDAQTETRYTWQPLAAGQDAYGYGLFVAHPNAVAYDGEFGLRWSYVNQPAQESPEIPGSAYKAYAFDPDTYVQHIDGLLAAYTRPYSQRHPTAEEKSYPQPLRDEYRYALLRTADQLGITVDWDTLDRYLRLTIALHDVGKLNRPWQNWAQARHKLFVHYYPDAATNVPADGTPLAHTVKGWQKFTIPDEKTFETEFRTIYRGKRGNHAVESAEATREIIWQAVDQDFWYGIISAAICHHHTPAADTVRDPFKMVENGREAIAEALAHCGFEAEALTWAEQIRPCFQRPSNRLKMHIKKVLPARSDYRATLLYYLVVRILRLADQRSSQYLHS